MNEQQETTFEAPGRGGFVPEKLLGRTADDLDSTGFSTMGLEEVCLENIVMAQLNQDILRRNFEILINAIKTQAQRQLAAQRKMLGFEDMVHELKEALFQSDRKLEELRDGGAVSSRDKELDAGAEKRLFLEEIAGLKVLRA